MTNSLIVPPTNSDSPIMIIGRTVEMNMLFILIHQFIDFYCIDTLYIFPKDLLIGRQLSYSICVIDNAEFDTPITAVQLTILHLQTTFKARRKR